MPLPPLLLVPSSSLAIYILEVTINILHNAHSTLHYTLYWTLNTLLNITHSIAHSSLKIRPTLYSSAQSTEEYTASSTMHGINTFLPIVLQTVSYTAQCTLYSTRNTARCIVHATLHAGDYKMLTMVHSTGQWHSGGRHCFVFVLPGSWPAIFGSIFIDIFASMLFCKGTFE